MRILFLNAAWDLTPEYTVHRILAEHADPNVLDCYFIWQDNTHDRSQNYGADVGRADHNFFWDFGRNMSLKPKPSKLRRASMMLARLPASLLFLARKIHQIQPDVIYTCQQTYDLQLVRVLRPVYRIPHLIHLHYHVGPWLGRSALGSIRRACYLFAVSDYIRHDAIVWGVDPSHIATILNPADLKRFDEPRRDDGLRAEFGWEPDTRVVVAAGRLHHSKGQMRLLESFAHVHREMPHARLLICGSNRDNDGYDLVLKRRVAQLGLANCVILAGGRADLPRIFAAADVFCLPTEHDPCPLVFPEAMAAGLPVVACRSGGVTEVVRNQETGLLSELGDTEGLTHNLLHLLRDTQLATRMGEAGRHLVLTELSPSTLAATWTDMLYERFQGSAAKRCQRETATSSAT